MSRNPPNAPAGSGNRASGRRPGVALAALCLIAVPAAAPASGTSGAMGRPALMARIYTSEVPPAASEDASFIRIAVIIPPRAEVASVQAFMDVENFGRSTVDWRPCDLASGDCAVAGGRVRGLRRIEYPDRGEVLLDFWNDHPEQTRFGKLRVIFRPQGNLQKIYRPKECWLRTECGYAGWMDLAVTDAAYRDESDP